MIENGPDRAVGERADLNGARGRRFQPGDAERPRQTQDAKAGSDALLGVGPVFQDQIAQRRRCRADEGSIPADTADGPIGIAAMAEAHVLQLAHLVLSVHSACQSVGADFRIFCAE